MKSNNFKCICRITKSTLFQHCFHHFFQTRKRQKDLFILHDQHYDVIVSMPAFFALKMYCHTCKKGYDHVTNHLCPDACKLCRFPNCRVVSWLSCVDCNRLFKSQACFDRHKQNIGNGKSRCASFVKCDKCHTVLTRGRLRSDLHHCGLTKCSTCNEYFDVKNHQCYIQPVRRTLEDEASDESGYEQLLFFDFECRQEHGTHEPNLCVIQNEAGDEWIFQGDNTRNEFCEWLFTREHGTVS